MSRSSRLPQALAALCLSASLLVLPGDASSQVTLSARAADLRLGGRFHAQHQVSSVEGSDSQFLIRRARLEADITVDDFFAARIQPDFGGGTVDLKDAYATLRFSPEFALTMGQFKRPFDLFELSSSVDLSLIERDGRVNGIDSCAGVGGICSYSRLTERLGFADRDLGVQVSGGIDRVSYQAALTNGAGANRSDENGAKSLSGRVSFAASDEVLVSGQVAVHDYPVTPTDDQHAPAWGLDVQVGGFRDELLLQGSWVQGDNWRVLDAGRNAATFRAAQVVASYYVARDEGGRIEGIEPIARVSFGDPNTAVDDDGGLLVTPGLMLYLSGRNKIGANLDLWAPQTGDTEYSFKLQTYVYF